MKRTCRPFLVLSFSLLSSLLCVISSAQQSHGDAAYRMFAGNFSAKTLFDRSHPIQVAELATTMQRREDRNPTDTALCVTNALTDSPIYYFYEPFPMDPGSSFWQIGGSVSLVPYPDAEQEYPMPGLDIQYKRGIFNNVSFVGSFSTSIFSNLFHTGIQWNSRLQRFSYGIANHVGFAYGFIERKNLFENVQAYGFFYMPMLRIGYRFDEFSLSCSFVITYIFKSNSYVNNLSASLGPQNSINDYYCTFVVEQPFLRNLHLSIGMSMGYARTPYQSWMLYNTVDEWLFVPEFFFAVQL